MLYFQSVFLYLQTHQLCHLIRRYCWKRFYCSTGWCERVFLILKAIVYTSRRICHIVQELIKRNWYRIKQHSYIWRCLATFSFSHRFLLFSKQISTEIDTIIKHEDSAFRLSRITSLLQFQSWLSRFSDQELSPLYTVVLVYGMMKTLTKMKTMKVIFKYIHWKFINRTILNCFIL